MAVIILNCLSSNSPFKAELAAPGDTFSGMCHMAPVLRVSQVPVPGACSV